MAVTGLGQGLIVTVPAVGCSNTQRGSRQALRAHYRSVALKALKDVRQALARHAGEQQHLSSLQAALEHSQRGFALAQASYRAGTQDGLALLDSERELIALHDQLLEARGKVASAQIDLFRALGGGW